MTRLHRRLYMRQYLAQRKKRGVCADCGRPSDGKYRCFACRVRRAALETRRREERRAA